MRKDNKKVLITDKIEKHFVFLMQKFLADHKRQPANDQFHFVDERYKNNHQSPC